MTGGEGFAERGLVPRAIHDVFKEIKVRIYTIFNNSNSVVKRPALLE
jgi:hypothetical protein